MKSKLSKIVYKVYEAFSICSDVFFYKDEVKEPGNFMEECTRCGERCHRKCQLIPIEVFVKPNYTWELDKFLFSTHFLFRKSEV